MTRLVLLFALAALLAVPAWADVISPGEMLVQSGVLPALLVIAVVVVTAIIVRKNKKK